MMDRHGTMERSLHPATVHASLLRSVFGESRLHFAVVALFSAFVNLLMLTGPVFMLQVYDRVLTSRSEATLVALAGIVAFLFLMMGLLDHFRARVLARAGARFQDRLDARVLGAIMVRAGHSPQSRSAPAAGLHDLEAIQRFASNPGAFAFFDVPWTPVFLLALFTFHWTLGLFAVLSGVALLALALLNQTRTGSMQEEAGQAAARAFHLAEQLRAGGETVRGLGMRGAVIRRVSGIRKRALERTLEASDRGGAFAVTARTMRFYLQSMMLALGAWLAIQGAVTPGAMIAATILLGRALAPIDQAVSQWPVLQRALQGRRSLERLLDETPEQAVRTALPAPDPHALRATGQALLEAHKAVVVAPGAKLPVVRGASFRLEPGMAIGIAGPSASGKSTLARALVGVWEPIAGTVTLAGASLDQYGAEELARHVGWLPQEVVLFEGTVAENIARFDPDADPEAVVAAARRAGVHEMVLALPGGYDFAVAAGGEALSGGQRQRIALARALYREPVVAVLDEPDAHLDAAGAHALNRAVAAMKARGGAAVIVAHRSAAFADCDVVCLMEGGRLRPMATEVGGACKPARGSAPTLTVPVPAVAVQPRGAGFANARYAEAQPAGRGPNGGGAPRRCAAKEPATATGPAFSSRRAVVLGCLTLAVLLGGVFGWGASASIAGAVIAAGRVEVEGRDRVVEHIDGGTVSEILVGNGDRVELDGVLVRFDDRQLRSEEAMVAAELAELVARRNRLEAEFGDAELIAWDEALARRAKEDEGVRIALEGQRRLFEARRTSREGYQAQLRERIAQTERQIASLEAQNDAVRRQGGFVVRELEVHRALAQRKLTKLERLMELEREAARVDGQAGDIKARIAVAKSRIAEIRIQILQIDARRVEEAQAEAREVQARENQVRERLASLRERLGRMEVRAPVAGEVFDMRVFSAREVVSPGEPILRIVPLGAALVVRARLEPIHIDQVWPGQEATLLFPAFSARTTPMFEGRVVQVAADASHDPYSGLPWFEIEVATGEPIRPRAKLALVTWAAAARDTVVGRLTDVAERWESGSEPVPERGHALSSGESNREARGRWSTHIAALDAAPGSSESAPAPAHAGEFALAPGMPAEVHIRTGERSPLSYLIKPLTDYFSRSLREE